MTRQEREMQIKKRTNLICNIIIGIMVTIVIMWCGYIVHAANENLKKANFVHPTERVYELTTETEQQYIVRYGVTNHDGTEIVTEDCNIWGLVDAPEFAEGTQVRVLFDSNGTKTAVDDVIIDITERN